MFKGIDFNGRAGHVDSVKSANSGKSLGSQSIKLGLFGNGFSSSNIGFQRDVVPKELATKFDTVKVPKYTKNIPQLEIEDQYYINDNIFEDEGSFCEC